MKQYLIFGIFLTLINKKRLTAKEIGEHFEISPRTVYRYVDALAMSGLPIYTEQGKNGGIRLAEGFKLEGYVFSEKEKLVLKQSLLNYACEDTTGCVEKILKSI